MAGQLARPGAAPFPFHPGLPGGPERVLPPAGPEEAAECLLADPDVPGVGWLDASEPVIVRGPGGASWDGAGG